VRGEVAVAIALCVLAAGIVGPLAAPLISDLLVREDVARAQQDCRTIVEALARYHSEHGAYPPGAQGNAVYNYDRGELGRGGVAELAPWLLSGSRPHLAAACWTDPWGSNYSYHVCTQTEPFVDIVVYSRGPDGVDDSWDGLLWNQRSFAGDDVGAFLEAADSASRGR